MTVRLLAVADIHGRAAALQAIREAAEAHNPDALIVAGDLTDFGNAREVRRVLDSLPGRVLAIPGNLDVHPAFEAAVAQGQAGSLVRRRVAVGGVIVAGLFQGLSTSDVLVVHEPPRGILDDIGGGRHIGLPGHLDALYRLGPRVLLCGHCHECPGVAVHGGTTVVNCTLGQGGRGALVEVGTDTVAARLL